MARREEREEDVRDVVVVGGGAAGVHALLALDGVSPAELPEIPGLRERWGREVIHCPYCHGWEVRDRLVGVLATGPMSVHQALLFRQWSGNLRYLRPAPGRGRRRSRR